MRGRVLARRFIPETSAGASTFYLSGETCQTQVVSALVNQITLYSQTLDLKQKNVQGFRNLNKEGNLIALVNTTFPNITEAIYYCLTCMVVENVLGNKGTT